MGLGLYIYKWEGSWLVGFSNGDAPYKFHGFEGVRALSHATLFGKDVVVKAIDQDLIFVKGEDDTGALIYDHLFVLTVFEMCNGAFIMKAAEGSTLDAESLAAGEALAAMVIVTAANMKLTCLSINDAKRAPAHHLLRKLTAPSSTPDFSVKFINSLPDSSTTFSSTCVSIPDYWPERIMSQPKDTLSPHGREVLSIECSLKNIALGPFDATWGWQNGDVWFAVMIHVPLQEGRVGNAPSYEVSWSTPKNESVNWLKPVKDPGQSWVFPANIECNIQVDSQAAAQGLHLTVTISNLR